MANPKQLTFVEGTYGFTTRATWTDTNFVGKYGGATLCSEDKVLQGDDDPATVTDDLVVAVDAAAVGGSTITITWAAGQLTKGTHYLRFFWTDATSKEKFPRKAPIKVEVVEDCSE